MRKWKIAWPPNWIRQSRLNSPKVAFSLRDCAVTVGMFFLTSALCLLLRHFDPENDTSYVAVIFLLDVFLTAMLTEGYLFSVVSAVMGVLAVDYAFTEPYWRISFVVTGFPLTFIVMMFISLATGMMTSRARRAAAMAREAERQKTYANLLRAVSHDIRTPLTGILGATNVLLEQEDQLTAEQRRALLTNASEDAQWLIQVVENLLSITRMGGSETTAQLRKSWEALEEIVEASVSKFSRRYPQISLRVEVPEELLLVPVDPLLIQQVLNNLLENAVIHGKTTSIVSVRLERVDENWAAITVEDNGCGIAPEKLPTIFDGRVSDDPYGDVKRNMGIGLSVCHTVIRAHRGKISAENKTSGGASFRVELPMKEETHEN